MFNLLFGGDENEVKSVASYPNYFDENIPNVSIVAMLHEIMHTYIPLDKNAKFQNSTQELIYDVINHSIVELASNCELGVQICGVDGYFQVPMHDEILKQNFQDENGAKKDFFISQGVNFPSEFEFESVTDYPGIAYKQVVTQKDELSNDKIRAIVYPYFLAFKNLQSENSLEQIISEMIRDRSSIIKIYGQEFYERISNPEYISRVLNSVKNVQNLIELNDIVARETFGIEKQITQTKSTQDLGRETLAEQNDTVELDKIASILETQERAITNQRDNQEESQTL